MEDKNLDINFRKIDKTNYNVCVSLKVAEHQSNFVASNVFSLVRPGYDDK